MAGATQKPALCGRFVPFTPSPLPKNPDSDCNRGERSMALDFDTDPIGAILRYAVLQERYPGADRAD